MAAMPPFLATQWQVGVGVGGGRPPPIGGVRGASPGKILKF